MSRKLGGPRSRSGCGGEEKEIWSLPLSRTEPRSSSPELNFSRDSKEMEITCARNIHKLRHSYSLLKMCSLFYYYLCATPNYEYNNNKCSSYYAMRLLGSRPNLLYEFNFGPRRHNMPYFTGMWNWTVHSTNVYVCVYKGLPYQNCYITKYFPALSRAKFEKLKQNAGRPWYESLQGPPHPDRLWSPLSLLSTQYRGLVTRE
jgi:hypothetical protein